MLKPRENRIKIRLILGTHSRKGLEVFRDVHEKVELTEFQTRNTISGAESNQPGFWSNVEESESQQRATGAGSPAQRHASRSLIMEALTHGPARFDDFGAQVMEANAMRLPAAPTVGGTCAHLALLHTSGGMKLTNLLIPSLLNQLQALSGWLDKAEAFTAERGGSRDNLLALRLAPDMFPLTTQLRFLTFQAQEPIYRLRGEPVPEAVLQVRQEGRDGGEKPGTWAEARARVANAASFLAEIGPDELDGAASKQIAHELPMGMIFDMTGEQYVRDWALPQAAFHQMIAYAILRQAGVPLGKVDYVPHMFGYLRPGTAPA